MGSVTQESCEAISSYIADLVTQEQELRDEHGEGVYTRLSLIAFDTVFEPWLESVPVASGMQKVCEQYQPRGRTALYDAIAETISAVSKNVKRGEKALVVVMTDGAENASQEYGGWQGRQRLFDLVKSMEAKGNWTFTFLGANVNAYVEAAAIGIPEGNSAFYATTSASMGATGGALRSLTHSHRVSGQNATATAFADAGLSQDYRGVSMSASPGLTVSMGSESGVYPVTFTPTPPEAAKPEPKKRAPRKKKES